MSPFIFYEFFSKFGIIVATVFIKQESSKIGLFMKQTLLYTFD